MTILLSAKMMIIFTCIISVNPPNNSFRWSTIVIPVLKQRKPAASRCSNNLPKINKNQVVETGFNYDYWL